MDITSLGYRTDLELLRLGGSQIEDRGDHLVVRSPHNPDHWWGNFLLLGRVPAPESAELWVDRFAAEFPRVRHIALGFDGRDGRVEDLDAFDALGLRAEAQTVMTATQVHRPKSWNDEADYRPLQSDGDWQQSVDLRVLCMDLGLDPVSYRDFAAAKGRTNRQLVEEGRGKWFGAFLGRRLVCQMGLLAAGAGLARFQSVETDPGYRRQGLAGSLVYEASGYGLGDLGAQTLVMVADPDYFAIDLYRSVGFNDTERQLQAERPPVGVGA